MKNRNLGILEHIQTFLTSILRIQDHDRAKLFFATIGFMLVIGGYTVIRTLKDSLFINIVGRDYIPFAKGLTIFMLIPCVLLFSKLVDLVKRYQLIYIYSIIFGVGGILMALLLHHPTIGLPNIEPNSGRIFGWFIYLFVEGYNPFLVSVYWSFMHSITSPEESKASYPILVAGSKIGGMIAASIGCSILASPIWGSGFMGEIVAHQVLLGLASSMILLTPFCIYVLMKKVPKSHLHGYEAAYRVDKIEAREAKSHGPSILHSLYSMFSGFILLLKYPYALGMFGIVFFWEVINCIASFERLAGLQISLSHRTTAMLQQDLLIHAGGFLIALIGTRAIVELLGERKSLILVPLITAGLLVYYFSAQSAAAMGIVYILLRVMNFAFAVPLRERLYTATTKEIKFKSKLWIDSFGVKIAKGAGSGYNLLAMGLTEATRSTFSIAFFSTIIGVWTIVSHCMGKSFEKAVSQQKVIGAAKE